MKLKMKLTWLPLMLVATCLSLNAQAAETQTYLKFESTEGRHTEWINLLSVSGNITRPMSGGRSSATLGDIVCVGELDKATPRLRDLVAPGDVFSHAYIEVIDDQGIVVDSLALTGVEVVKYAFSRSDDGTIPTETLSLNFEEAHFDY